MVLNVSPNAKQKTYDLTIEVVSENGFVSAPFRLNVLSGQKFAQSAKKDPLSVLLGLFSLSEGGFDFGGLLIILLIIAVAIILVFLLLMSSNKQEAFLAFEKRAF